MTMRARANGAALCATASFEARAMHRTAPGATPTVRVVHHERMRAVRRTARGDGARDARAVRANDDGCSTSTSASASTSWLRARIAAGAAVASALACATTMSARADVGDSPMVAEMLRRTEANKELRAIELQNKYCARQAAIGVGDCAGVDTEDLREMMMESKRAVEIKAAEAKAALGE